MKTCLLFALAVLSPIAILAADKSPLDPAARLAEARKLAAGLKPQQGDIALHGNLARLHVPSDFRYLNPTDTETVLVKIWGNPRGGDTLGMLVPANFDPLYGTAWAVIITYTEDGYVKDNDAASINYDKLLAQMKDGVKEASKQREKEGYPSIELVGWAAPPRYDKTEHKLYWAKELKFGNSIEDTLNYNIRILGRRGVLVLNAVAGMAQLSEVESATPAILAMVNFTDGNRYADFNSNTDKVATYGLAALIAGGIAAKAGLFKLLWIGILAAKKFIIIAVLAIVGFIKKFLGARPAKKVADSATPGTSP